MVSFEWDPDNVPVTKLGIHCAQIVLAFVGWCLQLAVFTGDGAKIVGDNGWNFGVVSRLLSRQAMNSKLTLCSTSCPSLRGST